jgi:hypothetical protein
MSTRASRIAFRMFRSHVAHAASVRLNEEAMLVGGQVQEKTRSHRGWWLVLSQSDMTSVTSAGMTLTSCRHHQMSAPHGF